MTRSTELTAQWTDYRNRARMVLWLLAGVPLVGLLLAFTYVGSTAPLATVVVALLWVIALGVAALRLQFFPCPNCDKPFAFKYINNLPFFVGKCVHCGLPKWEH